MQVLLACTLGFDLGSVWTLMWQQFKQRYSLSAAKGMGGVPCSTPSCCT